MWPFAVLEISPTDDKAQIKRAYAKVLKKNRPDENPQGFQRVNEAYQAALTGHYYSAGQHFSTSFNHEKESYENSVSAPLLSEESKRWGEDVFNVVSEVEVKPSSVQAYQSVETTLSDVDELSWHDEGPLRLSSAQTYDPHNKEEKASEVYPEEQNHIAYSEHYQVVNKERLDSEAYPNNDEQVAYSRSYQSHKEVAQHTAGHEEPFFDFNEFYHELFKRYEAGTSKTLKAWLYSLPALWSLDRKDEVGGLLMSRLGNDMPALHKDCFDDLAEFFGFNERYHFTLSDLRERLHMVGFLKTGQEGKHPSFDAKCLAQMIKPFSWPQALFATFPPWRARKWQKQTAYFLDTFGNSSAEFVNQKQLDYWLGTRRNIVTERMELRSPILFVMVLQWLLLAVGAMFIFRAVMAFNSSAPWAWKEMFRDSVITTIFLSVLGIPVLYYLWLKFPYIDLPNKFVRRLSIAWVPFLLLVATGLYLQYVLSAQRSFESYPMSVVLLLIVAGVTAIARNWYTNPEESKRNSGAVILILLVAFFVIIQISRVIFQTSYVGYVIIIMYYWYVDLQRQYDFLKIKSIIKKVRKQ